MKRAGVIAILVAAWSLGAIPTASAQEVTCDSANFSPEVIDRFPGIRYSCLEIVQKDGAPHAVLNAIVTRVRLTTVNLKFRRTAGGLTKSIQFRPPKDYRFAIDGRREVPLRDLTVSSELRVYVPVESPTPTLAFEPVAAASMTYIDYEEGDEEMAPALPKTAGDMPVFAVLGSLFLIIAGGLAFRRRTPI
jgi:LPXTG-motif cell wall-anchored protein